MAAGAQFGIGWVYPDEIDTINIHNAALLAMTRALESLFQILPPSTGPLHLIVDGKFTPEIPSIGAGGEHSVAGCTAMVRADGTVPEVMAASIIAKTARDRLMVSYGESFPEYGFERHMGYPTPAHKEALRRYGPTSIHRISFRGVAADSPDRQYRSPPVMTMSASPVPSTPLALAGATAFRPFSPLPAL